jgi:hypothetical protein
MNKMKIDIYNLTDAGKRNLLRSLCDELTAAEINKLVEPYACRLELDEMREPYIIIQKEESEISRSQIFWIDVNDIATHTIDTDD